MITIHTEKTEIAGAFGLKVLPQFLTILYPVPRLVEALLVHLCVLGISLRSTTEIGFNSTSHCQIVVKVAYAFQILTKMAAGSCSSYPVSRKFIMQVLLYAEDAYFIFIRPSIHNSHVPTLPLIGPEKTSLFRVLRSIHLLPIHYMTEAARALGKKNIFRIIHT